MPNTLAHVGFQGLITRSFFRGSDLKWIYLGCVLPDFPWIMQRFVEFVVPGVDPYDLRLYGIVQASFLFCLFIGLAIALLSDRSFRAFSILALNAFLHLLLDAGQVKWASGVHFLAPVSWNPTNFGFFWPESPLTYILTTIGLVMILATWKRCVRSPVGFSRRQPARIVASITLASIYIILPFYLLAGPGGADNHFVNTLRDRANRPGRYIEIDRNHYDPGDDGGIIRTFAGEALNVEGLDLDHSAVVSIRGRFQAVDRLRVEEYHVHTWFRNMASYVGLSMIALIWMSAVVKRRI